MFPISLRIIGSKKPTFFYPVIYPIVTTCLCYLFLIAFFGQSNNKQRPVVSNVGFYNNLISSSEEGIGNFKKKSNTTSSSNFKKIGINLIQEDWVDVDNETKYFTPWPKDNLCKNFTVRFAKKKTFKPRALVSFPGSGNSWLRYLIEASSGIFTGSVFNDYSLYRAGLLGEFESLSSGKTIIIKTHHDSIARAASKKQKAYVKLSELVFGYRGILLIRNPFEAILSYYNFYNSRNHKGYALPSDYNDWENFAEEGIEKWSSLIKTWLDKSQDLLILCYEDLKKDPRKEIIRILQFLERPINEPRIECVLAHLEGPFHRQHSEEENSEMFYSEFPRLIDLIKNKIGEVNSVLREWDIPMQLNYTFTKSQTQSNS